MASDVRMVVIRQVLSLDVVARGREPDTLARRGVLRGRTPVCRPMGSDETYPSRTAGFCSMIVAGVGGRGRTIGAMPVCMPITSEERRPLLSDGFRINFDSDVGGRWRTGLHAGFSLLRKPPFALLDTDHERGKCAWKVPSLGPSSHLAVPGRDPAGSAAVLDGRSRRTDMLSQVCGGREGPAPRREQQQRRERAALQILGGWLKRNRSGRRVVEPTEKLWRARAVWGKNATKEDQYSMTSSSRRRDRSVVLHGCGRHRTHNPLDCLKQRWQVEPAVAAHRPSAASPGASLRPRAVARSVAARHPVQYVCMHHLGGTRLGLYPMLRDSMRSRRQRPPLPSRAAP